MNALQPGILAPVPVAGRYLSFGLGDAGGIADALRRLKGAVDGKSTVFGLGHSVARALGHEVPGLRSFPTLAGALVDIPSTPDALWLWLRGSDRGELLHRGRRLTQLLAPAFALEACIDAFRHDGGRDLTGYEDGTENPKGRKAALTVAASGVGGMEGSSFVAVQQWVHDFARFEAMKPRDQDNAIGRRRRDNKELVNAPASAHVKRTAQESFTPEAFVLRRSMPWTDATRAGLVFVAFGRSFDSFEAQLTRMSGLEDGVTDALFGFSRPVTGAYFWCPAMRNGRLDLRPIGV